MWYGNFLITDTKSGEKSFKKFFSISVNLHLFNLWISRIILKFNLASLNLTELLIFLIKFFSGVVNFLGFLKDFIDFGDLDNSFTKLFFFVDLLSLVSLSKLFFDLVDLMDEFEYSSSFTKLDLTYSKFSTVLFDS